MRAILVMLFMVLLASDVSGQTDQPILKDKPISETGQGNGGGNNQKKAAQELRSPRDLLMAIKCISATVHQLITKIDEIESQRPDDNEIRDLKAQEQMALWAKWMFWATIGTVIVAAIGIYYVRKTLMETRRIGQAQVRAYLSCESFSMEVDSGWVWFYPIIKNNGQSPAETTRFSAYMDVSVPGSNGRNKSRDSDGDGPYIAAGQSGKMYIAWSKSDMPEKTFAILQNGSASFEIFCRLYCRDVFEVERKTTFLISVGKDMGISGSRRAVYEKGTIDHLVPGVYDD